MSGWPSDVRGGFHVFSAGVGVWPAAETGISDKTAVAVAMTTAKSKNRPLI
jgi:hypothetical protein